MRRRADAIEAARILAARLGSELDRFLQLIEDIQMHEVLEILRSTAAKKNPEPSNPSTTLPMDDFWNLQAQPSAQGGRGIDPHRDPEGAADMCPQSPEI